MKIAAIAATAGICLAIGLGAASVAVSEHAAGQPGVSQLRGQVTRLQQQVSQLEGQLSGVRASVNGEHRDLITCGDFQSMNIQNLETINLNTDPSTNTIYATPNSVSVPLPAHCINQ